MKEPFKIPVKKLHFWTDWKIQRRLKKMANNDANVVGKKPFSSLRYALPIILIGGVSFWVLNDFNQKYLITDDSTFENVKEAQIKTNPIVQIDNRVSSKKQENKLIESFSERPSMAKTKNIPITEKREDSASAIPIEDAARGLTFQKMEDTFVEEAESVELELAPSMMIDTEFSLGAVSRSNERMMDESIPALLPTEQFVEDVFTKWLLENKPKGIENHTHEADKLKIKLLLEVEQDPEYKEKEDYWMERLDKFWKKS